MYLFEISVGWLLEWIGFFWGGGGMGWGLHFDLVGEHSAPVYLLFGAVYLSLGRRGYFGVPNVALVPTMCYAPVGHKLNINMAQAKSECHKLPIAIGIHSKIYALCLCCLYYTLRPQQSINILLCIYIYIFLTFFIEDNTVDPIDNTSTSITSGSQLVQVNDLKPVQLEARIKSNRFQTIYLNQLWPSSLMNICLVMPCCYLLCNGAGGIYCYPSGWLLCHWRNCLIDSFMSMISVREWGHDWFKLSLVTA